ncbi:fruit protein pKIWI502-like [Aristolochia californica]|uniref:fruit protein pKIWI502-like n=1 Tax=Aristolochia californica TaxID=171875 RepID=UPI0035DDCFF5
MAATTAPAGGNAILSPVHLSFAPRLPYLSTRPHASAMTILPRLNVRALNLHRYLPRRSFFPVAAAVRQDTTVWSPAPLSLVEGAAQSLFNVSVDLSDCPDVATSFTRPGQYLQLRVPTVPKPVFLAIASSPSSRGEMEFLVKSVPGTTAEALCGLRQGDLVELSMVMGKGYDIDQISPPEEFPTVLLFASGAGISPIRSLIEWGFGADKRSDVRLYYGTSNLEQMAYQDKFKGWESSGIKIVPVLSEPDDNWNGERGYVQDAFGRDKRISDPQSTGAVLCGPKEMTEAIVSLLTGEGVSSDKILDNL